MKRLLVTLVAVTLCGIGLVRADENVRAVQSKLKEGGFYFGDLNGTYGTDTSAAVTRYQIRKGLPISGKLDAETSKSLGVAAGQTNAAPAQSEPETWRNLRKTDDQFLSKMDARKTARQPTKTAPAPAPPQQSTEPPPAPEATSGSTFTLSRERLRDYIAGFVLAGLDPQTGAELEFFGDRVRYYDSGMVDHERIRSDLQSYARQWPQRRFWLAGEVQIQPPRPDGLLRVTFPLRYQLQNQAKRKSGRVVKTLELQIRGDDLEIVGVNERKG